MADLQVSSPRMTGVAEDRMCSSPPSSPLPTSNPDPSSVGAEAWSRAEKTTRDILCRIQPTLGADQRRRGVVDYVQRLITFGVGCKVMLLSLWLYVFFPVLSQLNVMSILSSIYVLCPTFYRFCDC